MWEKVAVAENNICLESDINCTSPKAVMRNQQRADIYSNMQTGNLVREFREAREGLLL